MAQSDGRSQRWLSGFGALDWRTDERAYAALLDALTHDRLELDATERERQAPAVRSLANVHEEQHHIAHDELAEARRELDVFRDALTDIRQRCGADTMAEVPYDSSQADQNDLAGVLIQYLVRPGYAEVRTEEPERERYVYFIRVDWPRLRELARAHGHPIAL